MSLDYDNDMTTSGYRKKNLQHVMESYIYRAAVYKMQNGIPLSADEQRIYKKYSKR